TTGLDIQSRTALWDEVARLAREDEVTVFLTTQYLEEADVLADRVGIIDHGHIVAEGTTDELKAEVGRPTVEAIPADPEEPPHLLERFRRSGLLARAPLGCAHDPPAGERHRPAALSADAARGQLRRPRGGDAPPRLSDQLLCRLCAGRAIHPGSAVRDHERGHGPRARHPDWLSQPTFADADARGCPARRPARRGRDD